MDRIQTIVVGAGVVGLAIARALALAGQEVLVLEAAGGIGTGISSRNSGVIHAGLYYKPDSLRGRFCAPGRRALYAFCASHGVAVQNCGKLIVATDASEFSKLVDIVALAAANGVEGMVPLSADQAVALEPALRCAGALHSTTTGIVDTNGLMLALQGDAQDAGAVFAFGATVDRVARVPSGFTVRAGDEINCAHFVNAAGLGAVALARSTDGLDPAWVPPAYLAKGNYFALTGRSPFSRLIYPVPVPGGAGTHLTLDLAGQARFGPDVEPVETADYTVDSTRAPAFYAAIRRYWPGLPDGALRPDYAGIRPKIVPPTQAQDFVIHSEAQHGVPGLINLFGIESPGLTSCLAIGDYVAGLI